MEIHTIGIDLGKTVFHLVGLNPRGEVVVRRKYSRNQILRFTANLRVSEWATTLPRSPKTSSKSLFRCESRSPTLAASQD